MKIGQRKASEHLQLFVTRLWVSKGRKITASQGYETINKCIQSLFKRAYSQNFEFAACLEDGVVKSLNVVSFQISGSPKKGKNTETQTHNLTYFTGFCEELLPQNPAADDIFSQIKLNL